MNRDEQYRDALADFHELISEGLDAKTAIVQACTDNQLEPAIFEQRLAKAGSISDLVEKITEKASRERRNAELTTGVASFCKLERSWIERSEAIRQRMFAYLETNGAGRLTSVDRAFAEKIYKIIRDQEIEALLNQAMLKINA